MNNPYYLTTPIYYVNAKPHLGHIYTTMLCDVMVQYQKLLGKDAMFLTGVDEHGDKIVKAAASASLSVQDYVDLISGEFQNVWKNLHIQNNDFIRTTEERHKKVVQNILQTLFDKGDIYLSQYEGYYCFGCERYLTEKEMDSEGKCPDHQIEPEIIKESNYFFKLQKYLPRWETMLKNNSNLIQPDQYYKEILGTIHELMKTGEDLSISRPVKRLQWGIPIPFDEQFVTYVWFDALVNYISALDYPDGEKFHTYWPQAHHMIAKDILKPHGIFWPAMLMAADIEIFQNLYVHGYWLGLNDLKMSKSMQNAFNPLDLIHSIGLDSFRYFLMKEMTFGSDSKFTDEALKNRLNQDLSNNLGNLIQRTLSMIKKYCNGNIPPKNPEMDYIIKPANLLSDASKNYHSCMQTFQFSKALDNILEIIDLLNKSIEEKKPWALAKTNDPELLPFLRLLMDGIGFCMHYMKPFLAEKFRLFTEITGLTVRENFPGKLQEILYNESLPENWEILFPRID
ncbi:MAG: methionine--tRNA ligase [Spirochaetia bacterium]|nr:methionine--tRNA ligase [Spirochaetia bacterium]